MMRIILALPLLLAAAPVVAQPDDRAVTESAERLIRAASRNAYERCLRIERASANPTALELAMLRLKCGAGPDTAKPQQR